MDITHSAIRDEVEAWATAVGQRAVAIAITESAIVSGITGILLPISDERGNADERMIYNNRQQLFRWLRSENRAGQQQIALLWPAIKTALPAERRARLIGEVRQYLVSVANKECTEAVNAAILNDPELGKKSKGSYLRVAGLDA